MPWLACGTFRFGRGCHVASDHRPDQRFLRDRGGRRIGDQLAVTQHDDAVGNTRQFVQAVRDIEDRHAFAAQRVDALEQRGAFVHAQHRRRLVEDQHTARAGQCAGNLDHLPVADAEGMHGRRRIKVQTDARERLLGPVVQRGTIDKAEAPRQVAKEQVLCHRERRHHAQFLQHHAHAQRFSSAARGRCVQRASQHHRTRGRRLQPAEDLGERALARAVLTRERKHLARMHVEIDVAQHGGGVVLADGRNAQQWRPGFVSSRHGWRRLACLVDYVRVTRSTGVSITPVSFACGVLAATAFKAVSMPKTACWLACWSAVATTRPSASMALMASMLS